MRPQEGFWGQWWRSLLEGTFSRCIGRDWPADLLFLSMFLDAPPTFLSRFPKPCYNGGQKPKLILQGGRRPVGYKTWHKIAVRSYKQPFGGKNLNPPKKERSYKRPKVRSYNQPPCTNVWIQISGKERIDFKAAHNYCDKTYVNISFYRCETQNQFSILKL